MNLKSKVKSGLTWSFLDQVISQIIFVGFSIYLARILSPSAYGIVGMVTVFTNFAILFVDLGFGTALVQKIDADQMHYSSVFWINLIAGVFLYGLFYISAPFISTFYKEVSLTILIRVMCLSFIIRSITSVQSNLLDKALEFKKKVLINWVSTCLSYALAIYLACNKFGVWALVWLTLSNSLLMTMFYWISSPWRPSFIFSFSKIKELSRFGLNLLGDTTTNYWSRNFDNFIIGKVLGSADLGIYSRSYSLMMLPIRNITSVITKVMFPAFSTMQQNIPKIGAIYLRIIKYIALITFPLMFGLAMVSKEFVLIFFGQQWIGMIPILSLLSILGAFQSIVSLNGLIYNSLGKAHIAFRVSIVVNIILISSFVIGIYTNGLIGLTVAYLLAGSILTLPIYYIAIKQINLSLFMVFNELKWILVSTLVMTAFLFIVGITIKLSLVTIFIVKTFIGGLLYILTISVLEKRFMTGLKNKLIKSLGY